MFRALTARLTAQPSISPDPDDRHLAAVVARTGTLPEDAPALATPQAIRRMREHGYPERVVRTAQRRASFDQQRWPLLWACLAE